MTLTSTVDLVRRGPSLTLSFSSVFDKGTCEELVTKEFPIDDLVKVRFKLEYNTDQVKCSLSAMKLKSEAHSVQMMVRCEDVKCSEQWQIHSEKWIEYEYMGFMKHFQNPKNKDINCNVVQINISVSEVNASDSHTKVYNDTDSIDFHLKASDGDVGVHKLFLSAHSDVFKGMLNGKWKETAEGCVEVEGVTRQTLQHLKDYLYLGVLPDDGLRPLLLLARYYLIEDLKTKCIKKLTETVRSGNLYELMKFACENNIPELTIEILHFAPNEIVDNAYKKEKKKNRSSESPLVIKKKKSS